MKDNKPLNLLMIITDQQRADTIGAYGNRLVHTPNFDRLAASGIRCDRAYCEMPECAPARAMMFSGQWGHRTGNMGNGFVRKLETTFVDRLNEAGYWTEYAGKMHAFPKYNSWGFQKLHRSEEGSPPGEDDYKRHVLEQGLDWVYEPSGIRHEYYYVPQAAQVPDRLHNTTWVGDRAVDFLSQVSGDRPWLFAASFIKPHPPFDPTTPYLNLYDPEEMPLPAGWGKDEATIWPLHRAQNYAKWSEKVSDNMARLIKAAYYACVAQIDVQIGRILDALEKQGLRENTLILFTADHGEMLGDHGMWGKRSYYNGAARIPFILSCPGVLPEGEVNGDLIGHRDIAPTLLDAAGLPVREDEWAGASLFSRLRGERSEWRKVTCGELMTDTYQLMDRETREKAAALYMAADMRWKYIYSPNGAAEALFDLENDPEETASVHDVPACEEPLARLRGELLDFFRREGFAAALSEDGQSLRAIPLMDVPTMRNRQYSGYDPHHLELRKQRRLRRQG